MRKLAVLKRGACALSVAAIFGGCALASVPVVEAEAVSYGRWNAPAVEAPVQEYTRTYTTGTPEPVDLLARINYLEEEMQRMQGAIEMLQYTLDRFVASKGGPAALNPIASDDAVRINDAVVTDVSETVSTEPVSGDDAIASDASSDLSAPEKKDEAGMYQMAFSLVQQKQYGQAQQAFRDYLARFPQGQFAPNSHYWLGELYLIAGSMDAAKNQFELILVDTPKHTKAADALLKLGYMYYDLGQWKQSEQYFTRLTQQFPDSSAAQLAKHKLSTMQRS